MYCLCIYQKVNIRIRPMVSLFHIHSDIIASVFVDTSRVDFPFDIHCVKLDIYYILLYPHTFSRVK